MKNETPNEKVKQELTVEVLKDIEKIFQGIGGMLKKIYVFLTSPALLLGVFRLKNLDRVYNKFLENEKMMKFLAFVAAIFFVVSNRYEALDVAPRFSVELTNIPLMVEMDREEFVLINDTLPTQISILLVGEESFVEMARTQGNVEAYIDIQNRQPGTFPVSINVRNVSDRLDVRTTPDVVVVTLAELQEVEHAIVASVENKDALGEDYILSDPQLSQDTVTIRGAQEIVSQISSVRAMVDIRGIVDSLTIDAPVRAYDAEGNTLDVEIFPATVTAIVEAYREYVEVPFEVSVLGEAVGDEYSISEIIVEPGSIKLFGDKTLIQEESYLLQLDLYQLNSEGEITIPLTLPEHVQSLEFEEVTIRVIFEPTEIRTLRSLDIHTNNLADGWDARATDGDNYTVDVILQGAESKIRDLTASDIEAYVDLGGLIEGLHEVRVNVITPEWVTGRSRPRSVEIIITE